MPDALLAGMRIGRALTLRTPRPQRVALLKEEYAHFLTDPALLGACLKPLTVLHGKAKLARWEAMASAHDWDPLIAELLDAHYDPTYARSLERNFPAAQTPLEVEAREVTPAAFATLAREVRTLLEVDEPVASR